METDLTALIQSVLDAIVIMGQWLKLKCEIGWKPLKTTDLKQECSVAILKDI